MKENPSVIAPQNSELEEVCFRSFFNASGGYVPQAELLEKTGGDSFSLERCLKNLETWGYRLDLHPRFGVRLLELPLTLHLDEVKGRLSLNNSWKLLHVRETKSTMDFLKNIGKSPTHPEALVIADTQSAGRGRFQRSWESRPDQGLYLSLLLRPSISIASYSQLTIQTAVATLQVIEKMTSSSLQIKWPNDLMIHGKKVAGILTEIGQDSSKQNFAVVGLGLNLLQKEGDFSSEVAEKATSLLKETQQAIRRADFLVEWIPQLQKTLQRPFSETASFWKSRCLSLGQSVTVETGQGIVRGTALDLEESGALILRTDSGTHQSIVSGVVV